MQKTVNRISQKRHHIPTLTPAPRNRRPKSLMPFVAAFAPNALRYQAVHDQRANLPLRVVVRRAEERRNGSTCSACTNT